MKVQALFSVSTVLALAMLSNATLTQACPGRTSSLSSANKLTQNLPVSESTGQVLVSEAPATGSSTSTGTGSSSTSGTTSPTDPTKPVDGMLPSTGTSPSSPTGTPTASDGQPIQGTPPVVTPLPSPGVSPQPSPEPAK